MTNQQTTLQQKDTFESRLISYLATLSSINNSYDALADVLSQRTGKKIDGRKITFYARGDAYAKKWLIMAMFDMALKNDWMPTDLQDWVYVIWTLTGKKQSVLGGDNRKIYQQLAELADKVDVIFENNFNQIRNADVD